jgi:lipopolysaccharide biosynthesis protein
MIDKMPSISVRILAFYLPQYHPIPENDVWWGKGFTEWTNVSKANPLFRNHHQPNLPGELGFYDLRIPEVREAQADLAKTYGIDGFCYWHYWFGNGKQLLERPFNEVLRIGKPDFPFCLAWANQSWTGKWHGLQDEILIEQTYPGEHDFIAHFNHLLPAFHDQRYIKINNKPLFIVYIPDQLPNSLLFTSLWNEIAIKNGFGGMYFIGIHQLYWDHKQDGFDEKTIHQPGQIVDVLSAGQSPKQIPFLSRLMKNKGPEVFNFSDIVDAYDFIKFADKDFIPTILPNWDNTPRSKNAGWVFQGSTPNLFQRLLENGIDYVHKKQSGEKLIFIKSWNEWAEGNYIEPDARWGRSYLEAVQQAKSKFLREK